MRDAAKSALDDGETFYNHNLGWPSCGTPSSPAPNGLHVAAAKAPLTSDRIAVTSAGVHAFSLVDQTLIDPGDRVVIVTPVWPNLTEMPKILRADVVRVGLDCHAGVWSLDLQRLLDATTPRTRLVLVNSPNNPTGWTMPQAQWNALLAHCRRHGIWIVADDAYERIVFEGERAPGVLAQITDEDLYISANTFSKTWNMTGCASAGWWLPRLSSRRSAR